MGQTDIDRFLSSPPDRSLDDLEPAIWRGVGARDVESRRLKTVISCQAALLGVALAGAILWGGAIAARAAAEPRELGVFSPQMALAPSTRLAGTGSRTVSSA